MIHIEVSPDAVAKLERLQQQFEALARVVASRRITFVSKGSRA